MPTTTTTEKFYVTTDAATNAASDPNDIVNGHLFQFTTLDNGTMAAVEVAGDGDNNLYNLNTAVEKDSAVNGMVTVMPGTRILKKESANIWARRSVMMGMFPPWGFISYFFSMLAKSTVLSYMQPSGLSRPQVFNLP